MRADKQTKAGGTNYNPHAPFNAYYSKWLDELGGIKEKPQWIYPVKPRTPEIWGGKIPWCDSLSKYDTGLTNYYIPRIKYKVACVTCASRYYQNCFNDVWRDTELTVTEY